MKPASKLSPAPVASTASTTGARDSTVPPRPTSLAPRAPRLITTAVPLRTIRSAPPRASASCSLQNSWPTIGSSCESPEFHRSDGSQLVSSDVLAPAARAAAIRSGNAG